MAPRRAGLAERRKAIGLTQEQLAERLGTAVSTVARWEMGATDPQAHMRPKLAHELALSVDHLHQLLRSTRKGRDRSGQEDGDLGRSRASDIPVDLRPHIDRAFEQERVTLDFAGFSGETLQGAVQESLDKIRAGRLHPLSVQIRALVPDASVPWSLPTSTEDLEDDPEFRARASRIMRRHMTAILDSIEELSELGLIEEATAEVRGHRSAPLFKLYIVNSTEVFFGFYPVREHKVTIGGESHAVYDLMGKDAVLFHYGVNLDDSTAGTRYVEQARLWFDSMWNTIARPIDL